MELTAHIQVFGKDYVHVVTVTYCTETEIDIEHEGATRACEGVNTCRDSNIDEALRPKIEAALKAEQIQYDGLYIEWCYD